ncbi:MAG: aldose 1-epimerase [Actinomycetota bacterium]
MADHELELTAGPATAVFSAEHGGRLARLAVDGRELLVGPESDPMRWGSYPMAPWAGRVRHGRFTFAGVGHRLPITLGPHAIHGTAYDQRWEIVDGGLHLDLGQPWPFPARLRQEVDLTESSLRIVMTLAAVVEQPAMLGWHPWFRRQLGPDGLGPELELHVDPAWMFELGEEMIPTGALIRPGPPPWDNCFELHRPPVLRWPGQLELTLVTDCPYWTIYTEPDHALCVEPQTDAPDAFNRRPQVVAAGAELSATFELSWRPDAP